MDDHEQARVRAILHQLPLPADDFVHIPLPRIAASASGTAAVAAAVREYNEQAKVIDSRLFRKVSLQMKGASLADLCAQLQEQTGVQLRASRAVADEKVTVLVKEQPARDVMRAVSRLFSYFWERSGGEGAYRYELDQDLRSQLVEEELRNRDANAALLAMDTQMAKLRPFQDLSFEQLEKRWEQHGIDKQAFEGMLGGGWVGLQLYHRLTRAERTALAAGQELLFGPDAADPDNRLPAEWNRPILQSMHSSIALNGQGIPMEEVPGIKVSQVRLRLKRSDLGEASLSLRITLNWPGRSGESRTSRDKVLATGRSPSTMHPDNAAANAALRHQPPFDQAISLRPEPSCSALKGVRSDASNSPRYSVSLRGPLSAPHVFSPDVWEAVHRETGLPIVADCYTRMYPVKDVTVLRRPLFEALSAVGDALGVRWTKDGEFLLGRGTSYYWDKLKEVPNRFLDRWSHDRDANGALPVADFLEMATLSDQQLDSTTVAEGITHCRRLPEWALLTDRRSRQHARLLTALTPDQLRRALQQAGIPFNELTPSQQQALVQLHLENLKEMEREGGKPAPVTPLFFENAVLFAEYVPAGCYVWMPPPSSPEHPWSGPSTPFSGRTPEEALAAVRRSYPQASADQVRYSAEGRFSAGIRR
jgi:hypothetical protein